LEQVGQSSYAPQARGLNGSDDEDDRRSVAVASRQRKKKGRKGGPGGASVRPSSAIMHWHISARTSTSRCLHIMSFYFSHHLCISINFVIMVFCYSKVEM
jgi:hypothetical protein